MNYRRDDTSDAAGRIHDRMSSAFGEANIFKDVDAIPIGVDFGDHIRKTLARCRVVLVLIGPNWLTEQNDERRIDASGDWVRQEIEIAFAQNVQVVPVLVNGATMPTVEALPPSIAKLATLNAAAVRRDPDFNRDITRLIGALKDSALTGLVRLSADDDPATVANAKSERRWTRFGTLAKHVGGVIAGFFSILFVIGVVVSMTSIAGVGNSYFYPIVAAQMLGFLILIIGEGLEKAAKGER